MEAQLTVPKLTKHSRTMWFNGITLVLAVLVLIAGNPLLADYPQAVEVLLLAVAIGNMILRRYFTTQPLTRGKQL